MVDNDRKKYDKPNLNYDSKYNFTKFANEIHEYNDSCFKTEWSCFIRLGYALPEFGNVNMLKKSQTKINLKQKLCNFALRFYNLLIQHFHYIIFYI